MLNWDKIIRWCCQSDISRKTEQPKWAPKIKHHYIWCEKTTEVTKKNADNEIMNRELNVVWGFYVLRDKVCNVSKFNSFYSSMLLSFVKLGLHNESYFHHHCIVNVCDKHIAKSCMKCDKVCYMWCVHTPVRCSPGRMSHGCTQFCQLLLWMQLFLNRCA